MTEYKIDVVCSDQSHAGKVAKVITFEFSQSDKDAGEADYWWTENVPNAAQSRLTAELMRRIREEREARTLGKGLATRFRRSEEMQPEVAEELGVAGRTDYHVTVELVDTEGKVHEQVIDGSSVRISHLKYLMRCPLCGLDLQKRGQSMVPILDRLMEAGRTQVPLEALIRLLT